MDPLSVAASVAGLVSLAGQLVPALYNLGSTLKEANKDAQAAAAEVAGMSVVLGGLQAYIVGRSRASSQRLQLITVEQITASLTACVFTYSELDVVLSALHVDSGLKVWDRAVWFVKREKIGELVSRIQGHKMTFTCMLNILQCASAGEAETNMDRLCNQIDKLLSDNRELSARLRNLEQGANIGSLQRPVASLRRSSIGHDTDSVAARSIRSVVPSVSSGNASIIQPDPALQNQDANEPPRPSAFEEMLHRSRVYRHAAAKHSDTSLIDDGRGTLALSICSSLTLGEVSNISVFALPVFAADLSNASAYEFARPREQARIAPNEGQQDLPHSTSSSPSKQRTISGYFRTKFRASRDRPTISLDRSVEPAAPVLGVSPESSIRYANVAISLINDEGQKFIYGYVPIIVAKTGVYLKENATEAEHIFMTGSPLRRLRELEVAFNSPPRYGKGLDWTGYTVYDAANVLLRFIYQLPEPLIPLDWYEKFRDPIRNHRELKVGLGTFYLPQTGSREEVVWTYNTQSTIRAYQDLITQLHSLRRQILLYLLDLLAVFASKSDTNKMTTPMLTSTFQPGLLSHPDHALIASERQLSKDVLTFLVDYQDHFLIGMAGTAIDDPVTKSTSKDTPVQDNKEQDTKAATRARSL